MKKNVRLGIAQINATVGDLDGNCRKIAESILKAKSLGVNMLSFPELAITGYPPEDLLLKTGFVDDNIAALKRLAKTVNDIIVVIGFVDKDRTGLYNAAAVIHKGDIVGIYHKVFLPNYGVFDEKRYFRPGNDYNVFSIDGLTFGVNICEDIWHDGPVRDQAKKGAKIILNINSSPYYAGRIKEREEAVKNEARANKIFISYANLVGGQDELVFDGQSMIVDRAGKVVARAEAFKEDILAADIDIDSGATKPMREVKPIESTAEIYQALLLGLKDYVIKNGFEKVVIGLSGGVDSALVATLAVDALGKNNVIGVYMPSRYSSMQSEADARELASNLGIKFITVSIEHIFKLYLMALEPKFEGHGRDTAEENLQARIRGNLLMALSNKFGWLVVTTGNKSEMSTGYATLYGDMAGGFALIKDVPKTIVYKLAKYRNNIGKVIPNSILVKEPTAELKLNQKDSDTLPPYEILDKILKAYVEEDMGLSEIIALGFEKETVAKTIDMVDKSEYKRRQSPPGVKITPKAFGKDRRMPITNKYK